MTPLTIRRALVASLTVHPLSHELFGQLPADEFEDLKQDIAARGLQYPPEVDRHQRIICGSQRFRAIRALAWTELEVMDRLDLVTEEQIREHLIRDNLFRRHLTRLQRFHAARALAEIETRKAAERMEVLGRTHGQDPSIPTEARGRSQEAAARQVGWSGKTYRQMERIVDAGDQTLLAQVDKGEISIKEAARLVTQPRHRAQPADEGRALGLRLARYEHHLDKLVHFAEIHPPAQYHPLETQVCALLESAERRLRAVRA